jgi:uncharacterized membrane protein YraQ (UPF0718 family)
LYNKENAFPHDSHHEPAKACLRTRSKGYSPLPWRTVASLYPKATVEKELLTFVKNFVSILYEAMPFIVLGAIIAGILEELVPQRIIAKIIPRNRILAIAIGGFLGIIFPMCECGIIPVMRRLLRKGVPLSCCVCYMLGGPILNVVVMLSTFVAFSGTDTGTPATQQTRAPAAQPDQGSVPAATSLAPPPQFTAAEMMGLRMGLGFLVAFGTSLIVEWQHRKHGNKLLAPLAVADTKLSESRAADEENGAAETVSRSWFDRLGNIAETALHDFVDITVYLIIGSVLASGARLLMPHDEMQKWALGYPGLAILIMMGAAIALCICSEADAFIAASFRALPPAPKLAFLVLGPMLDFKLFLMYTRVFRQRLIWTIIASVVVQVLLYSLLVHFVWEHYWLGTATS